MSSLTPFPGRECGACNVCCVELGIDAPELHKPDGVVCPNLDPGLGCRIYQERPLVCRTWYCGWRLIRLSDAMRPDLSRILLMPEMTEAGGYKGKGGLRIVLLDEDVRLLLKDEIVDLAGQCIARGLPIFLSYGNGPHCKRRLINDDAKAAIAAGDRKAFAALITDTMNRMIAVVKAEMAAKA